MENRKENSGGDLLQKFIRELNEGNALCDILTPHIETLNKIIKPYLILHIIMQMIVIVLLIYIVFCVTQK